MTSVSSEVYLQKARELNKIRPEFVLEQGFIVTCTEWGTSSRVLDFYVVKEVDLDEGRIDAVAIACHQNNNWTRRSRNDVVFWVRSYCPSTEVHTVSFIHPEDEKGLQSGSSEYAFGFWCPGELAIAQVGTRDKQKKLKLIKEKRSSHSKGSAKMQCAGIEPAPGNSRV